jgi:hypothetical protein
VAAVWICFRAELRSRRRAWLAIALLAGVAGGLVVAAAAASHRTATAYHRYLRASNSADAYVDPGFAFGGDESLDLRRVERLPEVASAEHSALLAAISMSRSHRPLYPAGPGAVQYIVATDGRPRDTIDRQKLLRGRFPDPGRPDEALIDTKAAAALEIDVGDSITLRVASHDTLWHHTDSFRLTADPRTARGGPLITVRAVGVSASARSAIDGGQVHLTSAFYRAHGGPGLGAFLLELETRLKHGRADLHAFETDVQRIAGKRPNAFFEPNEGRLQVQRSIALLARTLRVLAAIGAAATLLLVGQALLRQAVLDAGTQPTLRALGMSRRQLLGLGAARTLAIAVPATVLTGLLAVALSPLTPFGWARELEPHPGFAFDGAIVGLGVAVMLAAILVFGVLATAWTTPRRLPGSAGARPRGERRPSPTAAALAGANLPPAIGAGLRMALLRRGSATALRVRTTLATAVLAAGVAVAALTFAASLQHLLDTPRLYGRTWDFEMAGGGPPFQPGQVRRLVRDPALADVAVGTVSSVRVGDRTTGVNAMDDVKGSLPPTVLEGRAPQAPDEILLGTKTAGQLHLEVGDAVAVRGGSGSATLRLVGIGVLPAMKTSKLGEGAAMSYQALKRIEPEATANAAEMRLAPHVDRAAAFARLRAVADGPSSAVTPADVADFGGVTKMPSFIVLVFVVAAAAALAHALVSSIRRRRRDVAVLKTLGFTRTQVMQMIGWQATTIAAVGLLAGVPLGLAVGRFTWNLLAQDLGVVPEPITPIGATALVVPAAIVLANLIAALPALTASRTQPALVLRAE